jgi:uncharacterized protein YjiS (DUF1127 family)
MTSTCGVAEHRRGSAMTAVLRGAGLAMAGFARRALAAYASARTRRILSGLDDYALKDIGLHRGQIDAVERDPRYTPNFPGF